MSMRIRTSLWILACCAAALTGCAASAPSGPVVAVRTPAVGRPQPPSSAEAALSREAFTPYAGLGLSADDGLAPRESGYALAGECMTAAGYPSAGPGAVPLSIRLGQNLAFAPPWGGWGYLGTADAEQYGFLTPPGSNLAAIGVDLEGGPGLAGPDGLAGPAKAAALACSTIVADFTSAEQDGALAGITTLGNDIASDVEHDAAVQAATQQWSACMARNGYHDGQPDDVFMQELRAVYGHAGGISLGEPVSAAAQQAQLAVAVTDADCTQSADLAGIYLAVQASYEQQLVSGTQQALAAAVRQYRAAYSKELSRLPALLRSAQSPSATSSSATS
jgi:hypothetical protein